MMTMTANPAMTEDSPANEEIYWRNRLAEVAEGSEPALEACYRHFGPLIHRFLLSRGCSEEAALQVLNETMLELWRGAAASFQGRSRISTWLLGIAHHRMIDHIRREARHDAASLDEGFDLDTDTDDDPEHLLDLKLEQSRLQECLHRLPGELRQLCYLVFFEQLPYADIARILDCPEGTIKSRIFHIRKRLRACLAKTHDA